MQLSLVLRFMETEVYGENVIQAIIPGVGQQIDGQFLPAARFAA